MRLWLYCWANGHRTIGIELSDTIQCFLYEVLINCHFNGTSLYDCQYKINVNIAALESI